MCDPPTPTQPDSRFRQQLLETLRALEVDPDGNNAASRQLRDWLSFPVGNEPGPHLELHELQVLAERRKSQGDTFQLPEHLLECRVCTELFQVLCDEKRPGAPQAPPDAGKIAPPILPSIWKSLRVRRAPVLSVAALLLLLALMWGYLRPSGIILEAGELRGDAQIIREGPLPSRATVESLRQTRLRFLDGSSILLEPGTRIRTGRTAAFTSFFALETGTAAFDFRDERTAPQIRAADLRIAPARAEFEVTRSPEFLEFTVHRGQIEFRHTASETGTLAEGDSLRLPQP